MKIINRMSVGALAASRIDKKLWADANKGRLVPEKSDEEIMELERTKPFTVTGQRQKWLNPSLNSLWLVPGMRIRNESRGIVITIRDDMVQVQLIRDGAWRECGMTQTGLEYLIRLANRQFTVDINKQAAAFFECPDLNAYAMRALAAIGIDLTRPFNINGSDFHARDGFIVPCDEEEDLGEKLAAAIDEYKDQHLESRVDKVEGEIWEAIHDIATPGTDKTIDRYEQQMLTNTHHQNYNSRA